MRSPMTCSTRSSFFPKISNALSKNGALTSQPTKIAVVVMGSVFSLNPGNLGSVAILKSRKRGNTWQAGNANAISPTPASSSREVWLWIFSDSDSVKIWTWCWPSTCCLRRLCLSFPRPLTQMMPISRQIPPSISFSSTNWKHGRGPCGGVRRHSPKRGLRTKNWWAGETSLKSTNGKVPKNITQKNMKLFF